MLRKYLNEAIIALALLILLSAYFYKTGSHTKLMSESKNATETVTQIKDIVAMKKAWRSKGLKGRLNTLRNSIGAEKIETFSVEKKKATIRLKALDGNRLNRIVSTFASLPIQIRKLSISESGRDYRLELQCVW